MVDFAVLPPEVVSARMYAGSGSGPLVAAAAAWDRLAATLGSAAASYRSAVSGLVDESWQGPASASMAAAAEPYVQWMGATAAQAGATANQVRAAAAAFEAAHAAVVPPPVVAANRSALSVLVAGNVLGQNSAAIAANQAEYGQMWAQDAAVMQAYATGSAAATKSLSAFSPAPQTANPAAAGSNAAGAQTGAAQNALTTMLGNLPAASGPIQDILATNTFTGLNGVGGSFGTLALQSSGPMFLSELCQFFELPLMTATGKLSVLGPVAAANAMGAATGAGLASSVTADGPGLALAGAHESGLSANGSAASAAAGRAVPVGKLSVPPSWAATAPEIRLAASALPAAGSSVLSPAGLSMAGGGFGGVPMMAGMVNTPRGGETRARAGSGAAPGYGGAGDQVAQNEWTSEAGADGPDERELDRLRDRMGDLAMECKAMARLMREAMR